MTDRELLELAAKAAGITLEWDGNPDGWMPMYYEGKTYYQWNPLDDDGDALRLAVRLPLDVMFGFDGEGNVVGVNANWDGAPAEVIQEPLGQDVAKATRRAIVRAAAEIWRAMK